MLISVNSYTDVLVRNWADEVKIDESSLGLPHIVNYIMQHPDKKYVFNINSSAPVDIDKAINYIKNKLKIENWVTSTYNQKTILYLLENGVPTYFNYGVSSFEDLQYLIDLGVSEVRIRGELGFRCEDLERIKRKHNIKIRAYALPTPNTLSFIDKSYDITSFFIRPEDLKLYDKVIDVLEFNISKQYKEKEEVLFNIYKKGEWGYTLKDLMCGTLDSEILNPIIPTSFAENRYNCHQKCIKDALTGKRSCSSCRDIETLVKNIEKTILQED